MQNLEQALIYRSPHLKKHIHLEDNDRACNDGTPKTRWLKAQGTDRATRVHTTLLKQKSNRKAKNQTPKIRWVKTQ